MGMAGGDFHSCFGKSKFQRAVVQRFSPRVIDAQYVDGRAAHMVGNDKFIAA